MKMRTIAKQMWSRQHGSCRESARESARSRSVISLVESNLWHHRMIRSAEVMLLQQSSVRIAIAALIQIHVKRTARLCNRSSADRLYSLPQNKQIRGLVLGRTIVVPRYHALIPTRANN